MSEEWTQMNIANTHAHAQDVSGDSQSNRHHEEHYTIHMNIEHHGDHESNRIKTSRYTAFTFIPYNLYYQFHRYYNLYFLTAAILSIIPSITPLNTYTSLLPILLTILISLLKDGWQDYKKYKNDKLINEKMMTVGRNGQWMAVKCMDIQKGDLVLVEKNQKLPVDLVVLYASHQRSMPNASEEAENDVCYMETSDLDGETNLKRREIPTKFYDYFKLHLSEDELLKCKGWIETETPNDRIHSFNGKMTLLATGEKSHGGPLVVPLNYGHFLPRSSVLKSTDYIIGAAVYIGPNCKIARNHERRKQSATSSHHKQSSLTYKLNLMTLCILVINIFILGVSVLFGGLFLKNVAVVSAYLNLNTNDPNTIYTDGFMIDMISLKQVASYFILFTFFVPISMFISIEMVRIIHAKFIQWDMHMRKTPEETEGNGMDNSTCHESHTSISKRSNGDGDGEVTRKKKLLHASVRNYNLHEELAMVKYIFTDKTGTLTKNMLKVNKWYIHCDKREKFASSYLLLDEENQPAGGGSIHLYMLQSKEMSELQRDKIALYTLGLSLCHTVIPARPETAKEGEAAIGGDHAVVYEGQSPDEIAIMDALKANGIELVHRTKNKITLRWTRAESDEPNATDHLPKSFEILNLLEFTSDRKKMSIIVKEASSSQPRIFLFTKGADSVILDTLKHAKSVSSAESEHHAWHGLVSDCQSAIDDISSTGLRMIVLCSKELTLPEYEGFAKDYERVEHFIGTEGKESEMTRIFEALSRGKYEQTAAAAHELPSHRICFLGGVCIDDKLQDHVKETLEFFLDCEMNIWCLTGDKKETAITIGKRCGLIQPGMDIITINDDHEGGGHDGYWRSLRKRVAYNRQENIGSVIVIDGKTIENVLKTHYESFVSLSLKAHALIACRTSPLQKSLLVRCVMSNTKHITLAIGDGSNDIGMLESAHIGIALHGKEGSQATRVADYSLYEFHHLKRLLTIHGRYSLLRLSKLVQVSVLKNWTLILSQFWFAIYSGFSASTIYNSYFLLLYNVIFTSFSPFLIAVFEKDVSEAHLLAHPELYKCLREGVLFNRWIVAKTILFSIYNSIVIFFFYLGLTWGVDLSNASGLMSGLPVQQAFMSTMTFMTVTLRTFLYTRYWVYWTIIAYVASIAIFVANMFALQGADYNQLYAGTIIHQLPIYYFSLLLIPLGALLPDFLLKYYRKQYYPRDADILSEIDHDAQSSSRRMPSLSRSI